MISAHLSSERDQRGRWTQPGTHQQATALWASVCDGLQSPAWACARTEAAGHQGQRNPGRVARPRSHVRRLSPLASDAHTKIEKGCLPRRLPPRSRRRARRRRRPGQRHPTTDRLRVAGTSRPATFAISVARATRALASVATVMIRAAWWLIPLASVTPRRTTCAPALVKVVVTVEPPASAKGSAPVRSQP